MKIIMVPLSPVSKIVRTGTISQDVAKDVETLLIPKTECSEVRAKKK